MNGGITLKPVRYLSCLLSKGLIAACCCIGTTLTGCDTPMRLADAEMSRGGFEALYPPESGLSPGDIWRVTEKGWQLVVRCPDPLTTKKVRSTATFANRESKSGVTANGSIDATLEELQVSQKNKLRAALASESLEVSKLQFGRTVIERLALDDMVQFGSELRAGSYATWLRQAATEGTGLRVISAVVLADEFDVTVKSKGTLSVQAVADKLGQVLGIHASIESQTEDTFELRVKGDVPQCVGFQYGSLTPTERLRLVPESGATGFRGSNLDGPFADMPKEVREEAQPKALISQALHGTGLFDEVWAFFCVDPAAVGLKSSWIGPVARRGRSYFVFSDISGVCQTVNDLCSAGKHRLEADFARLDGYLRRRGDESGRHGLACFHGWYSASDADKAKGQLKKDDPQAVLLVTQSRAMWEVLDISVFSEWVGRRVQSDFDDASVISAPKGPQN